MRALTLAPTIMNGVCLAVLNFNAEQHLRELIPTLIAARNASPIPTNIVVLDNSSDEQDANWLAQWKALGVMCLTAPRNDYLYSYNWMLPQLTEDVVILLNNDIRVAPDFIAPLLAHLRQDAVFAASARSFDWAGAAVTSGPSCLSLANGYYGWQVNPARQTTSHTLFCSGSCMAVSRRKFLELGGFHPLYYPAYCEDLDLCFRAWRRGWTCIYEPSSTYWHREQASWSVSPVGNPGALNLKGSLLFQWSTLPRERGRKERLFSTFKLLLGEALRGKSDWRHGLLEASRTWRLAKASAADLRVSDAELEDIIRRIGEDVPLATAYGEAPEPRASP